MEIKTRHFYQMLSKAMTHKVTDLGNDKFLVVSGETGNFYSVALQTGELTCTCGFATKGGYLPAPQPCLCSHTIAVINDQMAEGGQLGEYKATFRQGDPVEWEHLHRKSFVDSDTGGVITLRLTR